jgi:hypothetical protein
MTENHDEWTELLLVPETNLLDASGTLTRVVSMGKPHVYDAVTRAAARNERLGAEVQLSLRKYKFTYVRIPVTVHPRPNEEVRLLAVDVELHASSNAEAICWSMEPMSIGQEVKRKAESKLSASLKLTADVAPSVGVGQTTSEEYLTYNSLVQAFNLNQDNPAWEVQPPQGGRLRGIYQFEMIVRTEQNARSWAEISIRADIFQKGSIFTYRAVPPDTRTPKRRIILR